MLPLLMTGSEWFDSRPGGLNRYFFELFRAFEQLDEVDVHAWAFGSAPSIDGARSWGTEPGTVARVRRSRRRVDDAIPAVIDRHFALYGPPRSKYRQALHIVHFQGPWADESRVAGGGGLAVRAKREIERARYKEADHLIVLSAPFAEILVDDYSIPRDRISIIPPGVDASRFAGLQTTSSSDAARPVVLCVRRLEQRMGIDVLIRGWDRVLETHPTAELRIVGTGTAEASLRDLAAGTRVPQSIVFTGRVGDAELIDEYTRSQITVVPSLALEGFGLIALESLAAGRAPIVTDCGGLPDAVRGLDPSLIVTPGNEQQLASRIVEALSGTRPSTDACRAHAATFSWESVAQRHLDLYRGLGARA